LYLNKARRDGQYGRLAIEQMVLVYLSPTGTPMWEDREARPDATDAIQVIEGLKQEAAMKPSTLYHEILWLYADLLTRQKVKIDNVIRSCVRIYENNKNYVPALLCMATALFLNKQGPKARNQLKRIAKTPYSREYAREFEESYLFLGSIYIESKKYDLALKMCKMCIKHNKACGKAWENMGHIMENEQSYKDAAEYYENAWKYDSETTAAVGYKLAFNYLKAKEYIKTIDVCHKVLKMYPNYPRIRKDILEKAQFLLRT